MVSKKLVLGGEQFGLKDWGNVSFLELEKVFKFAQDYGFSEIDTSNIYGLGLSEINISSLKEKFNSDIKISTKVGMHYKISSSCSRAKTYIDCSEKAIYKSLEDSLRRLNVSSVECVYLHYPDPSRHINNSIDILNRIKSDGITKFIGICNCDDFIINNKVNLEYLDRYQTEINIVNYLMDKNKYIKLLYVLKSNNIQIFSYSPLKRGLLTPNFVENIRKIKNDFNDRRSRLPFFNEQSQEFLLMRNVLDFSESMNYSIIDFSLSFLSEYLEIDKIIVGFTKLEQIESVIKGKIIDKEIINKFNYD